MCLSIPGKIIDIIDTELHIGRVEIAESTRVIQLALLEPEEAQVGKWVLVNAGIAVRSLEADEASEILQLIEQLDQQLREE